MLIHRSWYNTIYFSSRTLSPHRIFVAIFLCTLLLQTIWIWSPCPSKLADAAQNATLGFGKIFYISLPQRTDRQDAIELLGSFTKLSLTYRPGVVGSTILDKAKPEGSSSLRPAQLGCWRGHADTWRRMINENIMTALILEDDVDWDVEVHNIFEEFSRQMLKGDFRSQRAGAHERSVAPYGYDWDVMFVGSCWDIPNEENRTWHKTYADPYAPNREELSDPFISEMEGWGAEVTDLTRQRIIAPSWYPVCLIGYAITWKGAQKLLYNSGLRGFSTPVDLLVIDLIQKGILKSYTVIPPIFTPINPQGRSDSDINEDDSDDSLAPPKRSENLRKSGREALKETLGPLGQEEPLD